MKKRLLFAVCVSAISLCRLPSASAHIFTFNDTSNGMSSGICNNLACLIISNNFDSIGLMLFNGADIDSSGQPNYSGIDVFSNVGHTFWVSSNEDDSEFSQFADLLTDGKDSWFGAYYFDEAGYISGAGWRWSTQELTGMLERNDDSLELCGYTVKRFGITINSADQWYDTNAKYPYCSSWDITYMIEADPIVPEPTTITSLIVSIFGLLCIRSLSCIISDH